MSDLVKNDVLIRYHHNCEMPWEMSCAIDGAGYGEWGFADLDGLIAELKVILKIHQEDVSFVNVSLVKKGSPEATAQISRPTVAPVDDKMKR